MPRTKSNRTPKNRAFTTQQSLNSVIMDICDIMRRSNCAGALQYVPELTWILFLRILDEREEQEAAEAEAVGAEYRPSLEAPYRWCDWAAPDGPKRAELALATFGSFFAFVNGELLPYLKGLLLRMGEKGNDGGQFFTPREIIRAMVQTRNCWTC